MKNLFVSLPVRYLGLPLLSHKLRPIDYQPLIDKCIGKILSWAHRPLSFAGRLQLIQSVLYGIINFWSMVFPLPKKCLDALERICSAFLWNGSAESARGAKVAWDSVCTPKEKGGLGLRRLKSVNQVFGLKLIWILFTNGGSLWVSWIKQNIIKGRMFWDINFTRDGSWIWKQLAKLRPLARPYLISQIVSGSTSSFWHDDWTSLGPIIDLTGPRVSGIPLDAVVSQAINQGSWLLPRSRHPIVSLLKAALPATPPILSTQPGEKDIYLWKVSPSSQPGLFSMSKTWLSLNPQLGPSVSWHKSVWFSQNTPRHAFILWLILRDRMSTRDKLLSWGLLVPSVCVLCLRDNESTPHLFLNCSYSSTVWTSFFQHNQLAPLSTLVSILQWIPNSSPQKVVKTICKLLLQAVCYAIWQEKNSRIHSDVAKPSSIVIKEIQKEMRTKLAALDRAIPPNSTLSSSSYPATYLSTWFQLFQI